MMTSAAEAFAFSQTTADLGSRQGDFFKTDQNRKAFLFEENASELNFQNQSEQENDFVSFYSNFDFSQRIPVNSLKKVLISEFARNKKNILKIQIFPFHFFW